MVWDLRLVYPQYIKPIVFFSFDSTSRNIHIYILFSNIMLTISFVISHLFVLIFSPNIKFIYLCLKTLPPPEY